MKTSIWKDGWVWFSGLALIIAVSWALSLDTKDVFVYLGIVIAAIFFGFMIYYHRVTNKPEKSD